MIFTEVCVRECEDGDEVVQQRFKELRLREAVLTEHNSL